MYLVDFTLPPRSRDAALAELRSEFGVDPSGTPRFTREKRASAFVRAVERHGGTASIRTEMSVEPAGTSAGAAARRDAASRFTAPCGACGGSGTQTIPTSTTSFRPDDPAPAPRASRCTACGGTGTRRGVAATPQDVEQYWSEPRDDQPGEIQALIDRLVETVPERARATAFWELTTALSRFDTKDSSVREETVTTYRWVLRATGDLVLEERKEELVFAEQGNGVFPAGKLIHRDDGRWEPVPLTSFDQFLVRLDFGAYAEHSTATTVTVITEPRRAADFSAYGRVSLTRYYPKGRGLAEKLRSLVEKGTEATVERSPDEKDAAVPRTRPERARRWNTGGVLLGLVGGYWVSALLTIPFLSGWLSERGIALDGPHALLLPLPGALLGVLVTGRRRWRLRGVVVGAVLGALVGYVGCRLLLPQLPLTSTSDGAMEALGATLVSILGVALVGRART
ncbi:hypothetical protein ABRQ22_03035 [Cellulosimicrobium sp. ES-005]|uniref:Glycine zipper 2TM domain-containing protein n=1 Tax=Cellulosimicrobium sp. ES-005 TaxID=3163031 RepID=A0AAU8G383_9MICO